VFSVKVKQSASDNYIQRGKMGENLGTSWLGWRVERREEACRKKGTWFSECIGTQKNQSAKAFDDPLIQR